MKTTTKIILSLISAASVTAAAGAANASDELWYNTPAAEWMEGAPLGNGRLGAIVYGGIDRDRVALNEITMWSGQYNPNTDKNCGPGKLAEIRSHFLNGDIATGNDLTWKHLCGDMSSFGTHLPVGDLVIDFSYTDPTVTSYRRSLDMKQGVATTTFSRGGVEYTREYFCDYPDNVMVMRFTASTPGAITATVGTDLLRQADIKSSSEGLTFTGKVDYPMFGPGGVEFAGDIRILAQGGNVTPDGNTVKINGADSFTILLDIQTDYTGDNFARRAADNINAAKAKGFDTLLANHTADHSALYNRMDINLGDGGYMSSLPTDTRLRLIKNGAVDPSFDALFFKYGRYMQIASSRPNSPLCSNLQGIWNDNLACQMAWTCDYHLDININQNYWSANKANLHECNEALFTYLRHLERYGAETARDLYGCNGWVAHTVANVWGYTSPGSAVSWGLNVTGGAWLATELWSHYLYTRDNDYLARTGYPLLKSCAEFFMDYMIEDPATGYLMTGPSISPENAFRMEDGNCYSASMMPTLDRAVVHQIYNACIESSRILNVDKKFRQRLEKDIKRLPPLEVGKDGLVKEWQLDVTRQDPSHRHASHLMSLYPFGQMSFDNTPELMEAAARSLADQTSDPNWENTEWSCGNMIGFYSFLKDADMAHFYIQDLFHHFTRENLMTVSPKGIAGAPSDIFSFDATEASVAGMCDMLLQSQNGYIEFLPALPKAWATGNVKGICAQGALEADLDWKDMQLTGANIRASRNGDVKVLLPAGAKVSIDGKTATARPDSRGVASFAMKAGQNLAIEI